jgi:hypothetical protein
MKKIPRKCTLGLVTVMLTMPLIARATDTSETTPLGQVPFKRLFTTTEQRLALDEWRRHGGLQNPQVSGINANETTTPEPTFNATQPVKLSGILLRADGKNTVWVNGNIDTKEDGNYAHDIRGNSLQSGSVKVPLRNINSDAILKPGQVWVPDSKRVEEAYQIAPPKPIVDINLPMPSSTTSSTSASATSNAAQSSSANASETAPNVESKANAKSK